MMTINARTGLARRVWHYGLLLLALAGVLGGAQMMAQEQESELAATLDAFIPDLLAEFNVAGASVAVIRDGELAWAKGYGLTNAEGTTEVTEDTRFQVASISKSVVAWAIMGLVEEGKLDLDAPVDQYLTRWQIPDTRYDTNEITIRRILTHTAGLSVDGYATLHADAEPPSLEALLLGEDGGDRVFVQSPPGVIHSYSGGGYMVLQLVIEEVTGMPFSDYMQQAVFEPLGMANTTYDQTLNAHNATGHDYAGAPMEPELHADLAAGGLYSTAADLARFYAAIMPNESGEPAGRGLLTPESVADMFVPADVRNEDYGFGYYIVTMEDGTVGAWHDGIANWFMTLFAVLPESGEGIVILTNGRRGDALFDEVVCAWVDTLDENAADLCEVF